MTDLHTNNISIINVGSAGYYVKDAEARAAITAVEGRVTTAEEDIETLKAAVKDGAHFLGKVNTAEGKTTPLTDGAHTTPIYIIGQDATVAPKAGDFVIQTNGNVTVEFIWDGIPSPDGAEVTYTGTWRELGSTGTLKAMAFVDEGTFTYTPAGGVTVNNQTTETASVTDPTFTGTAKAPTGEFQGTEVTITSDYTPEGTVSKPSITVTPSSSSVNECAMTAPSEATETVPSDETLTITFEPKTFMTGASAALDANPVFSGTAGMATATYKPTGTLAMDDYTPEGANSGTAVTMKPHNHAATFAGTEATVTVSPKNA